MPIEGILQPEIIGIDEMLRLRRFDGACDFALDWYQDPEMVWLVDGVREPYSLQKLKGMYAYLDKRGELYFIEILRDGKFVPVGDVTFWQQDMPIVIGDPSVRGMGLGKKIVGALIQRGKNLGYDRLFVGEIYDWNIASQKCFTAMGFSPYEKTEKGSKYVLEIK